MQNIADGARVPCEASRGRPTATENAPAPPAARLRPKRLYATGAATCQPCAKRAAHYHRFYCTMLGVAHGSGDYMSSWAVAERVVLGLVIVAALIAYLLPSMT